MNELVFTSKYVIEENFPVLYIVHDNEGDWQFLSKCENDENDGRVVSMEEILSIDPSLKDILWLPAGTEAHKKDMKDVWRTSVFSE